MNVDKVGAATAWVWLQAAGQHNPGNGLNGPGETSPHREPADPAGPTRAEVAETGQVPATLSSLHSLATTWLPPRAMQLQQDEESADRDTSRSNDEAPFMEGEEAQAFEPIQEGMPASSANPGYREIAHLLHAGKQFAALRDLATQRRVLVLCAVPTKGVSMTTAVGREKPLDQALRAHLLWTDAQGVGQIRSFSARWSGRCTPMADPGVWWGWRCHREQTEKGIYMRPRRDQAHQWPAIRLTGAVDVDPTAEAAAGRLDLVDTRRLLHLMGTQWSLRVVVTPEQDS